MADECKTPHAYLEEATMGDGSDRTAWALDCVKRSEDASKRLGDFLRANFKGEHREFESVQDTAIRLLGRYLDKDFAIRA